MTAVAEETEDVVFLSVRSGLAISCIARVEGAYPIKAYTRSIGDRRPLGFGCVGTIVLASLPDDEVREILQRNDQALRIFDGTDASQAFASRMQDDRLPLLVDCLQRQCAAAGACAVEA